MKRLLLIFLLLVGCNTDPITYVQIGVYSEGALDWPVMARPDGTTYLQNPLHSEIQIDLVGTRF